MMTIEDHRRRESHTCLESSDLVRDKLIRDGVPCVRLGTLYETGEMSETVDP